MQHPRRAIAPVLGALAAMLSLAFALAGCAAGATGAAQVTDSVDKVVSAQLDALKTPDEATVRSVIPTDAYDELTKYGIDPTAFYNALVSRFGYQIKDTAISSDGNSAQVTVSATNVDLNAIATSWASDFTAYVTSSDGMSAILSGDEGSLVSKGTSMLQDKVNASDAPMATADVTIDLARGSDGAWSLKDQNELVSALFAGVSFDDAMSGINGATSAAQAA